VRKLYTLALAGAVLALGASSAAAQRRLTGRVLATTGEPLVSAAVTVQGTPLTVVSGEDGRFAFRDVGEGPKVLVVRRIGYKRTSVTVPATQNDVEVKLEKDVLELEQVVITGAATSVSSANVAQAVTTISADALVKAPTPMLENALQGKIPGALVTTNSGAPGGGS
jgi:TonB-dependent starch-binding outer membrane protein SusC